MIIDDLDLFNDLLRKKQSFILGLQFYKKIEFEIGGNTKCGFFWGQNIA